MDPQTIQTLLDQKQKELGNRVAAPTYPEVSKDAQWQAYNAQHSDKVKQLFDYDSQLAQVSFQPTAVGGPNEAGYTAPESRILDPMIGLRAASTQQTATAGEVGDLLEMMNTRKQSLEDTYNKGLEIYKLGLAAQQLEIDTLNKLFSNAMEMEQLKETKRQFNVKQGETKNKMSLADLITLGQMGGTSTARAPMFSPSDPNKIYESDGHQWKYDVKTGQWQDLTPSSVGGTTGMGNLNAAQVAYLSQFPEADQTLASKYLNDLLFPKDKKADTTDQEITNAIKNLDELDRLWQESNILGRLNPLTKEGAKFKAQRLLTMQQVARIFESGRLSDQDRSFYQNLVQDYISDDVSSEAIGQLKFALNNMLSTGNSNVINSNEWE